MLQSLGENRRFKMLAEPSLEAKLKEIIEKLQGSLDVSATPVLGDVAAFSASFAEAGHKSLIVFYFSLSLSLSLK
jgi:hypothetical protein